MKDVIVGRRRVVAALAAVVALAVPVGATATTGLLGDPVEAVAGTDCGYATSPVFARWLDPGLYYLVPGGNLEPKRHGWTLAGAASVVAGRSLIDDGRRALGLGTGGTATTPRFCVTLASPTTRFVVGAPADPLARLRVDVVAPCLLGSCTATIGWVTGGLQGLRPSLPLPLLVNLTSVLGSNGQLSLQLRFTAERGTWTVDDVYVDPYRRV